MATGSPGGAGERDRAADRGDKRGRRAEREPGAGAGNLGEPADDRGADRRRAEEDHGVERHHAAAHRGLDRELQQRVDAGGERDADRAERDQREQLQLHVGAIATSTSAAANMNATVTSRRGPTRPRAPAASAPITEPTPIATASAV